MALDDRYIVASDLEQYFVDKDSGLPLAAGTLSFFKDAARNEAKAVYQLSGTPPDYTYTALPNPIVLSSVGTVQNSGGDNEVIYYFPYDENDNIELYYIECRNSDGVEQFTRQAWPNLTEGNDPLQGASQTDNQIANSQFSEVFINEGFATAYNVTAATKEEFVFAPNWIFVISGTGSVTVERIAASGIQGIITSPPYVLDVTVSSGITDCLLVQRYDLNSGLWATTTNQIITLKAALVARNENAGTTGLQMYYEESSGGSPVVILDDSFDEAGYVLLTGSGEMVQSANTDEGSAGYIDIYVSFLTNTNVRISSIQVVAEVTGPAFQLNSSNRELALMSDYYVPRAVAKQIPSLLTGWDFTLNPFQFGASGSLSLAAAASYIADQTIAVRGATGAVTYAIDSVSGGIQFTTAGTNDYFYIMQYLSGAQAKKILGSRLSVNVFGYKTAAGDDVTMQVYLCRGSSAATFPTLPATIGTVATNGTFTVAAANWTEIPRSGLDTAKATLNVATGLALNDPDNDYGFTGWCLDDATQINDTDKFAIVVTFSYPDAATVITINSISVVPGDLPCRPALQTFDQVLHECQHYYETSIPTKLLVSAWTATSYIAKPMDSNQISDSATYRITAMSFGGDFNTIKRTTPTMVFYTAPNTPAAPVTGSITLQLWETTSGGSTSLFGESNTPTSNWVFTNSVKGYYTSHATYTGALFANAGTIGNNRSGNITYNYSADARLGVV